MTASGNRPRRLAWVLLAAIALGAASVGFVKHQDTDNRFCVACHLHEETYRAFTASQPTSMAAAHFHARHAGHPERCFTCHSGEGVRGWSEVTLLSAWDAARWVAGDRHEPDSMRLKLENSACIKCHAADIRPKGGGEEGEGSGLYHEVRDHRGIQRACVACHTAHTAGVKPNYFMNDDTVRRECTRCHPRGIPSGSGAGEGD